MKNGLGPQCGFLIALLPALTGRANAVTRELALRVKERVSPRITITSLANHPFLFLMQDNLTGSILFMGWFAEPAFEHKGR
jgi:serine protease inhibitor